MKLHLAFVLLVFSCQNSQSEKSVADEDFTIFFERFSSEEKFQISRIQFPVKSKILNTDTGKFEVKILSKSEWFYTYFSDSKYLKSFHQQGSEEKVNIQVEDTGVSVDYIFQLANGKWYLIEIVDEST